MAKKTKEVVVLNKEELIPTTLGSMKDKDNGLIVTVILVVLFAVFIVFLPQIEDLLSKKQTPEMEGTPTERVPKKEEDDSKEETKNDVTYYDYNDTLSVVTQGFNFTGFSINEDKKEITFTITNTSGTTNFFKNHAYYMEFYTSDLRLLGRLKINSETINDSIIQTSSLSQVLANGNISKITIREIEKEEYPSVTFSKNDSNLYNLTCTKGNQTLTYSFSMNDGKYELNQIKNSVVVSNEVSDYETQLDTYATLSKTYSNVTGVIADLNPTSNGFEYIITLDLNSLSKSDMSKHFIDNYYYAGKTEAKVVKFELEAMNYICKKG